MHRFLYVAAIVLIVGYLVWPFGSLLRFYLALKSADETVVEQMVIWPSVRASIENQINSSAGTFLNQQSLSSDKNSSGKIKLSFDSISVAGDIAAKLATPKAFIFLFKQPTKMGCIWSLQDQGLAKDLAACRLTEEIEEGNAQGTSGFQGPNFDRLYEKTNYLFFSDPFTFRFDVQHEGIRIVLTFVRQSFGWKLATLSADWEKALGNTNSIR